MTSRKTPSPTPSGNRSGPKPDSTDGNGQNGDDGVGRFEQDLAELERIVQQMESADLSLETSLRLFERGVKLGQQCQRSLDTAELRVRELAPLPDAPIPADVPDTAGTPPDDEDIPF